MLTHIENIEKIFSSYPAEKPKVLQSIDSDKVFDLNWECYSKMAKVIEPSLLTSYFHRIFYNVDHLYIFKKQFTRYHATNSLFTYAFNLGSNETHQKHLALDKMSFCKETGRINFAESCSNKSNLFQAALVPKTSFAT